MVTFISKPLAILAIRGGSGYRVIGLDDFYLST